jgi:branched-subunit amino acid transport protein
MTTSTLWLLIVLAGAGTFLLRLSFLALVRGDVPPLVRRILRLVPMAVMAALIAPGVLPAAEGAGAGWGRPLAALLAVIAARASGSMILTLLVGMAALWLTSILS